EQEARYAGIVAKPLVAVTTGGPHVLDLHVTIPIRRRGHRASVGAKADQCCIVAKALTAELSNVQFLAHNAHLGVARIPDVRVVSPDNRFRLPPMRLEKLT